MDDNFSTIVDTIRDGRRIYQNIKKAIGYVFTIHIPIAFASLLAPLLNIAPANLILLPLHVVLLELLIDPTCSIVLERQPAEKDIMEHKPRNTKKNILTKGLLIKSLIQGLVIFAVSFGCYYYLKPNTDGNAQTARSMALAIIMIANIFLVQVNSSDNDFAFESFKRLSKDKVMWIVNIFTIVMLAVILYTPLNTVLKLAPLSFLQFIIAFGLAAGSVLWFEFVKLIKKISRIKKSDL
jgi:Ca2+-transporting ATPase